MPKVMSAITVVGTFAMLWVGGQYRCWPGSDAGQGRTTWLTYLWKSPSARARWLPRMVG